MKNTHLNHTLVLKPRAKQPEFWDEMDETSRIKEVVPVTGTAEVGQFCPEGAIWVTWRGTTVGTTVGSRATVGTDSQRVDSVFLRL